jgi:hypothetical protein
LQNKQLKVSNRLLIHSGYHFIIEFDKIFFILLQESIPFAVVGSSQTIEVRGKKVRGRLYPWGVVEVENAEHNDFIKLRTMLM